MSKQKFSKKEILVIILAWFFALSLLYVAYLKLKILLN